MNRSLPMSRCGRGSGLWLFVRPVFKDQTITAASEWVALGDFWKLEDEIAFDYLQYGHVHFETCCFDVLA